MTVEQIEISGRRWFQKTMGNTYHTVEIWIDGKPVHKSERNYGYGNQYVVTAREWLLFNGWLPGIEEGEPLWRYCQRVGIVLLDTVSEVSRKKDL